MKILQINTVCGIRSTGRIATDIYHVLRNNNHDCKIVYGRNVHKNIDDDDVISVGTYFDVVFHAAKARITDKAAFYSDTQTKKLIKKISDYNPDIIHLHNIHGYYINVEILFKFLSQYNKPIVWTLHDCWTFTGHCTYFTRAECDRWIQGCYECPQKESYPASYLADNSKNNYTKKKELFTNIEKLVIVTPSLWLLNLVKKSYLNIYESRLIYNGIDIDKFKPLNNDIKKKLNIENKKIILGVASSWGERKGIEDFYGLSEILNENYKIVLVGLNKKQIRKLPEKIIGIERTNSERELAEMYSAAELFFNPTYEDNFPTTNIEALACGTPVVTYNTGGSPESIGNTDRCGIVIEKGQYHLINKIICSEKFDRKTCVERAREFDKNIKYAEYMDLYKYLL